MADEEKAPDLRDLELESDPDSESDRESVYDEDPNLDPDRLKHLLTTINRQVLDFDRERYCSVSLSTTSLYACMVCGKYFRGKDSNSPAFAHALRYEHEIFINLEKHWVISLPDDCHVKNKALKDIWLALDPLPSFDREKIEGIDLNQQPCRALDGSNYLCGMVGLNNNKELDVLNFIIQSLMRVTPLRNFFLTINNSLLCKNKLAAEFGKLTRKIWHDGNFKSQVNPHEFVGEVMNASKRRFGIGAQTDPVEFMSWLLNTLHTGVESSMGGSIIHECFQGELECVELREVDNGDDGANVVGRNIMPFLMLGLDLPRSEDIMERNIIPQVQLFNLLHKFDGETETRVVRPRIGNRRYRVTRLPPYLILHMGRFVKHNGTVQKNPTLVEFPVNNLQLADIIPLPGGHNDGVMASTYDLISNIIHQGEPGEGGYTAFVQRRSDQQWYVKYPTSNNQRCGAQYIMAWQPSPQ